ncbi:MAG TPA: amino acid adenylation domain-containing protein, partial [Candidatus Saccharimonadales bacterium]|nr:amino acid adenylation domain-containing protein [Candidatus Saccharimonadales bacterium]
MLFQSLFRHEFGKDITQVVCEMEEAFDPDAFAHGWRKTAERYPILRTSFHWDRLPKPEQRVHRQIHLEIGQKDCRTWSPQQVAEWLQSDQQASFDLTVPPLFRVTLLRIDESKWKCVFTYHHILLDVRSLTLIFQEVFRTNENTAANEALPEHTGFRDFINHLAQQETSTAANFWREVLKDFSQPTTLRFARRSEVAGVVPYAEETITIGAPITAELRNLAKKNDVTLNTVVQCAWGLLLSRYSGEADVVFGAVRAGRGGNVATAADAVGLFINTVPVRVRINAEAKLCDLLKATRTFWKELRSFEHTSLAQIQGWSGVAKGQPLFDSLLNFQDPSWDQVLMAQGGAWERRRFTIRSQSGYPIALDIYGGDELTIKLSYDRREITEAIANRILAHWNALLKSFATNPEQLPSRVSILGEEESRRLLQDWNNTKAPFHDSVCVHELFEAQALKTPQAVAVSEGEATISYQELNLRSNQLAHYLRSIGVGPETVVGVFMNRSIEMIVGLLGILKAGGAYVPMDPAYPKERLAFMIEETRMPALLTQSQLAGSLPAHQAQTICLDAAAVQNAPRSPQSEINLLSAAKPTNLAYVIYTSGSTGKPKGVEVEHRSLMNLVGWHQRAYSVSATDRASHLAGVSFDASVWEIWPYLTAGARLYIPDEETRLTPGKLLQWLARNQITLSFLPTPLAEAVMAEMWPEHMALNVLLTGGDRLVSRPPENAKYILVNHYGPTENTVVSTWTRVGSNNAEGAPPIGRPISNTEVYVLDRCLNPTPIGVPGELYVGGESLARGYLGRPDLTQERFIRHPFKAEQRLYATGDLVRYMEDGNIEYLGRLDQQVKIRGHRIELGEIEFALRQINGLKEVLVLPRERGTSAPQLVAYVVPEPDLIVTPGCLRDSLRNKLPEAMVPAAFVFLSQLPLTPNGKIDRAALPAPDFENVTAEGDVRPRTPTEEMLTGIWEEVLEQKPIGTQRNFFECGGHSLLATQIISRVRGVFQTDLPLQALFENPTIRALASLLERSNRGLSSTQGPALIPSENVGEMPLSFAQERLWFLEQLEPGLPFNNVPAAVRLTGTLNKDALERSLNEIVRRHQTFRTSFVKIRGKAVAVITPGQQINLQVTSLTHLAEEDRVTATRELMCAEARKPFDLTKSPLLRAVLLKLDEEEHLLLITMHHIVSDGWSMGVFYRELTGHYARYSGEEASPFAEPRIQYA